MNRSATSFRQCLCVIVLLFVCGVGVPASAQTNDDVVRVDSSLVQLNVGVADRQGRAITDLTVRDFAVYEDDVRQQVIGFEPATTSFSLVLLLDTSGSTLKMRTTLKQAARRFIDALAPDDRVSVVAFNDKIDRLTDFTSDYKKIIFAIDLAEGRGGTRLYPALDFALKQLAAEGKRRKAIVVLTDGVDTDMRSIDRAAVASAQTPEEIAAAIKPETSAPLSNVLDIADKQGVTIYPLALPTGDPKRFAEMPPQDIAIRQSARARLDILAERTGGRLHEIDRLEQLGRLYAEVAADLRTLYSLTYQPSGGPSRTRDGRWHAIRIEVVRPELIARTRQGYFAR